tara:strand:- start:1528 stop:2163 length:636 start_codon:yes stop_codon:yes gene_type:complete
MYNLPHYKEQDKEIVNEFLSSHPFAFLTGCDSENRPVATQLPMFIEELKGRKVLRGHLMKNTDHHKAFLHSENVLAVFTGKHSYVSGSWYSNPHSASTWNYMSVHVKGVITFLGDEALEDVLRMTSLHFEEQNEQSPTTFDNLPTAYKQQAMKLITAFEIEVTDIETVFKLSQNRDAESYQNIITELKKQGEDARVIAAEMEKRIEKLVSK